MLIGAAPVCPAQFPGQGGIPCALELQAGGCGLDLTLTSQRQIVEGRLLPGQAEIDVVFVHRLN
jgi:hypothetical protein